MELLWLFLHPLCICFFLRGVEWQRRRKITKLIYVSKFLSHNRSTKKKWPERKRFLKKEKSFHSFRLQRVFAHVLPHSWRSLLANYQWHLIQTKRSPEGLKITPNRRRTKHSSASNPGQQQNSLWESQGGQISGFGNNLCTFWGSFVHLWCLGLGHLRAGSIWCQTPGGSRSFRN